MDQSKVRVWVKYVVVKGMLNNDGFGGMVSMYGSYCCVGDKICKQFYWRDSIY